MTQTPDNGAGPLRRHRGAHRPDKLGLCPLGNDRFFSLRPFSSTSSVGGITLFSLLIHHLNYFVKSQIRAIIGAVPEGMKYQFMLLGSHPLRGCAAQTQVPEGIRRHTTPCRNHESSSGDRRYIAATASRCKGFRVRVRKGRFLLNLWITSNPSGLMRDLISDH